MIAAVATTIDLNVDAGESFGPWVMGDDAAMFERVTTVNVAAGFHAGDPGTIRRTIELARDHGVAVGAHPGLPDRVGFGRRGMTLAPQDAHDDVLYQIGAVAAFCRAAGVPLVHAKMHGALSTHVAERSPEVADAIVGGRARLRRGAADRRAAGLRAGAGGCAGGLSGAARGLPGARLRRRRDAARSGACRARSSTTPTWPRSGPPRWRAAATTTPSASTATTRTR